MGKLTTDTVLMIRPVAFHYNEETAVNNAFQASDEFEDLDEINALATAEFDNLVRKLRDQDIEVIVFDDIIENKTPDSIFPNNWISFHDNGSIITYPMFAESRRPERREDIIQALENQYKFDKRYSFEYYEEESSFLEGTGSMVLDRENKIVYACLSPRTDPIVMDKFCILFGYSKILFNAVDSGGQDIYHTNVMMALGETFCVICLDSIRDLDEREKVISSLERTSKEIINITYEQMNHYAGNMLQLNNKIGEKILVMSKQAFHALEPEQVLNLRSHTKFIYAAIPTIEKYGGGSVRCMIGEVFSNKNL